MYSVIYLMQDNAVRFSSINSNDVLPKFFTETMSVQETTEELSTIVCSVDCKYLKQKWARLISTIPIIT
ncbi:hypothetical protein HZS_3212 [Henneguya salminicola]|nr:hypothetical protein HZS_3212 [Henneguya salminicola]